MLSVVAGCVAVATTGKGYVAPKAAPPAEGLDNPNAGKKSDKIEHFVVLFMENRTPDHFWACEDLPTGDFVKDGHFLPMDPTDPSKGGSTLKCGTATYVCPGGPGYDMFKGKVKAGGNDATYPYDEQSDEYSYMHGAHGTAIHLFGKGTLPGAVSAPRELSSQCRLL